MRYDFFTPPSGPITDAPDGEYPAVTVTLDDGTTTPGYVLGWTPTLAMVHWVDGGGWGCRAWMDADDVVRVEGAPPGNRQMLIEEDRRRRSPRGSDSA